MKKNYTRIVTLFVLVCAVFVIRPDSGESRHVLDTALKPTISKAFGKLPRSFEMNCGQTDLRVKFLSRGKGNTLFLTNTQWVLVLTRSPGHHYEHQGYLAHHGADARDLHGGIQAVTHLVPRAKSADENGCVTPAPG